MSVIALQFMGRWGNMLFQYAFARAYSERHNLQLQTDPWIGQKLFQIDDPPIDKSLTQKRDEFSLVEGETDFIYRSYSQQQKCLIYTREDCRRWFQWRPPVLEALCDIKFPRSHKFLAHLRHGDYKGYSYPLISAASYRNAAHKFGFDAGDMVFVREEQPFSAPGFDGELSFLVDFHRLMNAHFLFRANSSFSWWAATFGHGRVFSPVMNGATGGVENDVPFVEGNWPRFNADLHFVTDLYLKEK